MDIQKSVIVNPLWNTTEAKEHAALLNQIISDDIFPVIEIWDTLNSDILNLIKKKSTHVEFDVSVSPLMNQKLGNLKFNNSEIAKISFDYIKRRISLLSSHGITNISISSPFVDFFSNRKEQIERYASWLKEVCMFADKYGISICFEAFDIFEDKKRLLGKTTELSKLFNDLTCKNMFLTWDLGHICLNHENYLNSLISLSKWIKRVHISNYSFDKGAWYFGDKHLPFSFPNHGRIFENDIIIILKHIHMLKLDVSIAFEIASNSRIVELNTFKKTYMYILSLVNDYMNNYVSKDN